MVDSAPDGAVDDPADASAHGARRPRARLAVAAAVLLLLVVLAARGIGGTAVQEVLSIPPVGTVHPDVLGNGTPVFVVHTEPLEEGGDPVVDVIQAFATEVQGPITELVGWCAPAQQFVAAHHGPLYDHRGRRMPSAVAGRLPFEEVSQGLTARDDLIHRTAMGIAGRLAEDEPLQIGGIQRLQRWQDDERPALRPTVPPARCRLGAEDNPVVAHAFLRTRLSADRGGWQVTTGWLVVAPDGSASWCDAEPRVEASAGTWAALCDAPRPDVDVGFAYAPADVGSRPVVLGGPLAARLADGIVQRVAVLPSSTWSGSSLRGVEVVEGPGTFLGNEVRLSARDLVGDCAGRWPEVGGEVLIAAHPDTQGAAGRSPGRLVVEVDAVTCRTLSVRPG